MDVVKKPIDKQLNLCYIKLMKTYKTYQAKNAVKAAQVTNHIIAAKKLGQAHSEAKAEAYRLYNIKKGVPILKKHFSVNENKSPVVQLPPLPKLPPLPIALTSKEVN